jgi:Cu/Ag efflux protein CusF
LRVDPDQRDRHTVCYAHERDKTPRLLQVIVACAGQRDGSCGPVETKMIWTSKLKFVLSLGAGLVIAPGLGVAAMTNIEWLSRMEQIELSRGTMADHVHAQGTVRAVDPGSGTVTILHPEIGSADKSIWMPSMTMVFHVSRSEVLRGVKAGDNVRFEAARRRGAVMVTRITRIDR